MSVQYWRAYLQPILNLQWQYRPISSQYNYTRGQKSGILLFVQRTSHILTSSSKGRFKKMPNVYFINVWHDMQNIFDINNVL